MDDPQRSSIHSRFAGRFPAGQCQPVTLGKNGNRHIRRLPSGEEKETMCIGLACSEVFSGARLAKLLQSGFDYERQVMEDLMNNRMAAPLSIHTSAGVPEALESFTEALEQHLPWNNSSELDWCFSLQLEGASAVWAGIDLLLQQNMMKPGQENRKMVAVGATSYHGPPSTSFGAKTPLWQKQYQVKYPVPIAGEPFDFNDMLARFDAFLDEHGQNVGVMLVEPQWGSSQAALPWPKALLKEYIKRAKARGIYILADEIMCGLGRHGNGSLFVSKDWDLDPDAITFGKAIGGGVYPLSGAILKTGRDALCENSRSVMQSHTYAGSSVRALMTATEVLNELPNWFASIATLGREMKHIFSYLGRISHGMVVTHGQGLMWGILVSNSDKNSDPTFRSDLVKRLKKHCEIEGILPYLVPVGGLMITPVIDIDVGTIYEIGQRLEKVILGTMEEMGWDNPGFIISNDGESKTPESYDVPDLVVEALGKVECKSYNHKTRSCTSCTDFVCRDVRMRFVR